jgi:hypothetical protein
LIKSQLLDQLDSGPTTLAALNEFALIETIFKATHVDPAVRDLERRHKVERGSGRSHQVVSVRLAPLSLFDG